VPIDNCRTSGHSEANAGAGRSQLFTQALHASCSASSASPGSSLQRTGCQRLLPWTIGGGNGVWSAIPGADSGGLGTTSSAGGSGTLAQPANIPTMTHSKPGATFRRARRKPFMLVILLEALLALALLVLIVWWTMFSGRKKGEPVRDDDHKE
jgi:hypothetical protein